MDKEAQSYVVDANSDNGRCEDPMPRSSRSQDLSNTFKRLGRDLAWSFNTATEGIQEWTPCVLVVSYFIFSVCIYMIATAGIMKIFWFIYLMTNTYIAGATVVEALMSIGPYHESKKAAHKVSKKNWTFPTKDEDLPIVDLIIVAYLPNEQDIILDRIHYYLERIIYPTEKLRVNVIYNTPMSIEPLESTMHNLAQKYPQLRVYKVPNSKSKADNVNYYCALNTGAEVSAIYDCDHYPHPYGPRWAAERFVGDKTIETVQGRCVIYNTDATLMAGMIGIEFDKIYAVSHPGRAAMFNFGLFCGSNGYWRTSLLREIRMDESMLTEDIDSALRAFAKGAKVVHDLNVVSYELAPTTMSAFWKQRLRWSQGWLQVSAYNVTFFRFTVLSQQQATVRHMHLVWSPADEGKTRTFGQRFGLLSLLWIRESSYYLITQYFCLVISIIITDFPQTGGELLKLLFFQYPVAYWLFFLRCVHPGPPAHRARLTPAQYSLVSWYIVHYIQHTLRVHPVVDDPCVYLDISCPTSPHSNHGSFRACTTSGQIRQMESNSARMISVPRYTLLLSSLDRIRYIIIAPILEPNKTPRRVGAFCQDKILARTWLGLRHSWSSQCLSNKNGRIGRDDEKSIMATLK